MNGCLACTEMEKCLSCKSGKQLIKTSSTDEYGYCLCYLDLNRLYNIFGTCLTYSDYSTTLNTYKTSVISAIADSMTLYKAALYLSQE